VTAPTPDGGHLDLDAIAELDEGLAEASVAQQREHHLRTCPACAAARARLRTTRALLSTLQAEPMPDDVARRVDAALAAAGGTIVPATTRRRRAWSRHPSVAGLAAAAAVAGLVAAVTVGAVHHSSNDNNGATSAGSAPNTAAGAAGGANRPTLVEASGKVYTKANANTLIAALARAADRTTATPESGAAPNGLQPKNGPVPDALASAYGTPGPLQQCLSQLAGVPNAQPLAMDFAHWTDVRSHQRNVPALIVVLPHAAGRHDVAYVVGVHCATAPTNDIFYTSNVD
jgi:negative regulator of sigma E activity